MIANFTTLKETSRSIQGLKLIMTIYSHWDSTTDATRVFQAFAELFSMLGLTEFWMIKVVLYTQENEVKISLIHIQKL